MPKKNIEQLLQLATRSDLFLFALDYAQKDERFNSELADYLSKKYLKNSDAAKEFIDRMREAFAETKDLGDYWHSYEIPDWTEITSQADSIMDEARKLLAVGNAYAAACIAVVFFEQLQDTYSEDVYDYDEEGDYAYDVGTSCEKAEQLLFDAMSDKAIDDSQRSELLRRLDKVAKSELPQTLTEYDTVFDFDEMMPQLMATQSEEATIAMLDEQISQHVDNNDLHKYVERKIEYLRKIGKDDLADAEEQKHLILPDIRQIVVNRLVEQKRYDEALDCIDEGIDVAQAGEEHSTISGWKMKELEIYQLMGNKEKQTELCRELFIRFAGTMEYYHKLKALVPKEEWKPFLGKLLKEADLDRHMFFGSSELANIYKEEHDSEHLFQLIASQESDRLYALTSYSQYIDKEYAENMLELFIEDLRSLASQAANTKNYPRIREAMESMQRLKGGIIAAHRLAEEFRTIYHRRTSMMAEISKF